MIPVLRRHCVALPHCTSLVHRNCDDTALCGVASKLNSFELEMQLNAVICSDLWQKVIDILAPQRNVMLVA